MATYQLASSGLSPNTSSYLYAPVFLNMQPDDYGTLVVMASGARFAQNATIRYFLQGSFDGSDWFDIETCSPADTAYINGNLNSWCKVVPLAPRVRILALNANSPLVLASAYIIE